MADPAVRSSYDWYEALARRVAGDEAAPVSSERLDRHLAGNGALGETHGDARPPASEVERLVRDNARLMDRIDTLLAIQEREQVLRQQLQNQVERLAAHLDFDPAAERAAIRREVRSAAAEELKPVLLAILGALERFAAHREGPEAVAEPGAPAPALAAADFGQLPAILTQPLDELLQERPRSLGRRARRVAPGEPVPGAGPFTWTTVFSA